MMLYRRPLWSPPEGLELGGSLADDGGLDGGYGGGGFGGHDDGASYQLSPVGEEVRLSPALYPASLLLLSIVCCTAACFVES